MNEHHAILRSWLTARNRSELDPVVARIRDRDFVQICAQAGLAGVVIDRAERCDLPLSQESQVGLMQCRMMAANALAQQMHELERVLGALNDADIPVVLLKGAALNLTLYERAGLRPMGDIDLLVSPHQANDALRVLQECGCRLGYDLMRADFFPTYHYERELITAEPLSVRIDLHARPFRPLRLSQTISHDAFCMNAQPIEVGGSHALLLDHETQFIHLAAHAAFHDFERLIWVYDLKRFVEEHSDQIDWTIVIERASSWGLTLAVLRAMKCVEQRFGRTVPQDVIDRIESSSIDWRDRLVLIQSPRDAHRPLLHVLVNLITTPGAPFKWGYIRSMLIPDRAHMGDIYPYRHVGWPAFAHGWRALRTLGRLIRSPLNVLSRLWQRPALSR